jgi:hypothetical protein
LYFIAGRENVVLIGPPGGGKTHRATGIAIPPAKPGTGSCSPLTLIDEPEAFLHPPQARLLGRYFA